MEKQVEIKKLPRLHEEEKNYPFQPQTSKEKNMGEAKPGVVSSDILMNLKESFPSFS